MTNNQTPPKLSIITVNLNNADGLQKTLDSVAGQTYTNYEHLIIDGGSTDGSVEVIKEYAHKYNGVAGGLYWVSEPDKGIYNAMNKGIKVAKGEYCLFLNSGDWLLNNTGLQQIFNLNPNEDIVYCDILTDKNEKWSYPDKLSLIYFFNNCIGHPASLHKRTLFENYGYYDEEIKIVSDYGFFLKTICINKASYKHIPINLTCFNTSGISLTQIGLKEEEKNRLLNTYFPDDFEYILKYKTDKKELLCYQNSRIVQFIKTIQSSSIYKRLRNIKS